MGDDPMEGGDPPGATPQPPRAARTKKPAVGANTQTPQGSGQSGASTQPIVITPRADNDPKKVIRRKPLGKITSADLAQAMKATDLPSTSAKGANTQPTAKTSENGMETDQTDDLYPDAMAALTEDSAEAPQPTSDTTNTSQVPIAQVLIGVLYPIVEGAPDVTVPQLENALGERVVTTDNRSLVEYPGVVCPVTPKFPRDWSLKRPHLKEIPGYIPPKDGSLEKEGVWPLFYKEPTRILAKDEERLVLIEDYDKAGFWTTPVDPAAYLESFDKCSRAYCAPHMIAPLTLDTINPPASWHPSDNLVVQATMPLRCYRRANGLTPTIFGAERWCMASKIDTYAAVPLKDHSGVSACAPMHKPEFLSTKRIALQKWVLDFSACKSPDECVSLDASTRMRKISHLEGERAFPNVWLKREREYTTRESLRDSDLKILQLLIKFEMRKVDLEKEPYTKFPQMAYWGTVIEHPYLLALQLSTIPFSRAILLKTVAMIGYQNLELYSRSHEEYYSKYRSNKLVEVLWYCNIVHAMLRSVLDEVLVSTQAEFINRPYIRKQWKALDGLISMPVSMYHLVQFITTQEIHCSHAPAGIIKNENNQYMAIAEGQVMPISSLQDICLNLITVYHHHAHCMLALYDVDSVAYAEHDRCYRLNVLNTQVLLGTVYTYAVTNSFLPNKRIIIQRRFGWLQEKPTLEGQGSYYRLMPMTCWVTHKLQHKHLLTSEITSRINEEDLYDDWKGTPAPILCRAELERSLKKFGTIDQKVEDIAAEMRVNKPHQADVVMREVDYSSGEEYDAVVKDQEGAPEPATAAAWTARSYARARPDPIKTDDVRRRTALVEAQIGERALANIAVVAYPIESKKEKIDDDPTWTFASRIEKERIDQAVKTYKAEVSKGMEAYDSLFDAKLDTAPNLVKMRQHFTNAQRQINFLSNFFRKCPKEKERMTAENAMHLSAPFILSAGTNITIRWSMWFLIRAVKTETWIDTEQKQIANVHWNGVLESYQVCSQKYHVAAVREDSFKRYREAVNTIVLKTENRRFYVPDAEDLWRCLDCRSDLRVALHKDYCWHMNPGEPKAVIAYKRKLAKSVGGADVLSQLEQFHQARVKQAQLAIEEMKLPQEELRELAKHDMQLAEMLETAYPGSMGKQYKQATMATTNPNQPGPSKRQMDNKSLDGEPKGKPPKESRPSTSTAGTPTSKGTAPSGQEWQEVKKKKPQTSTARSKSRPGRSDFAKARGGGAPGYRGGYGRGGFRFGHSTEVPVVPLGGRSGQPRFKTPGFAMSTSRGGKQYHPSQNAAFLAKQEHQRSQSTSKKKRGSRGARDKQSGRDDTQDEEDSEDEMQ